MTLPVLAFGLVAATAVLVVARVVMADSFAERLVALDMLLGVIVSGVAVGAVATGDGILLNVLVVTALLGFVATISVARFMERRGT